MMILSFSLTETEYRTGYKTVTRRFWKPLQMERWQRAWDQGRVWHDAWTALPFVPGAERIGPFKLAARPFWQPLAEMTAADLLAEGGMCSTPAEFARFVGHGLDDRAAVVTFDPGLLVGMCFPDLCCAGYDLQVIFVNDDAFGTMWRCHNSRCPRFVCCAGDDTCHYNGVGWVGDPIERPRTVGELREYFDDAVG